MRNSLLEKGLALLFLVALFFFHFAGVRIKDLGQIAGVRSVQLVGYGLVVGLNGTGDSRQSLMANQSIRNMLKHFGMTLPQRRMRVRNVAAVMVTALLPPYVRPGMRIDVQVSSMGDATSLEGGILLLTPLMGSDGLVYARAQGAVSIGGFDIKTAGGEQVRKNYALVGRIPLGAIVEQVPPQPSLTAGDTVYVNLRQPDITTAFRVAEVVNSSFSQPLALAINPGQIAIAVPEEMKEPTRRMQFLAQLEALEVDPDKRAVVVVNERTGTIVVGKNVVVSEVAIAHGNLSVEISAQPVISQPAPFSQGQTVVVPQTQTRVTTEQAKLFALQESASVQDIATALNALGVTPRDLIAIFQALKAAGALNAELIIM